MEQIGLELRNLMNLIVRYTHKDVNQSQLSMPHAAIIKYLIENNQRKIHPSDLEDVFMMRKSTISRMLKLIEQNGFIEIIPDDIDSRKKIIKVTSKSQKFFQSMNNRIMNLERIMIKNVSNDELQVFYEPAWKNKTKFTRRGKRELNV